jgi:ferredoxin
MVDYEKCIGCGACAKVCPRNIISMIPFKSERVLGVSCSNKDPGKESKKACKVGCIGCKACVRLCTLFDMDESLAVLSYDEYSSEYMVDLEKACEKCPTKSLVFVGKPSVKDRKAVLDKEESKLVEPDSKSTVDDTQ